MNIFLKNTLKTLVGRIKSYVAGEISTATGNLATVATTGDYNDLLNKTHWEENTLTTLMSKTVSNNTDIYFNFSEPVSVGETYTMTISGSSMSSLNTTEEIVATSGGGDTVFIQNSNGCSVTYRPTSRPSAQGDYTGSYNGPCSGETVTLTKGSVTVHQLDEKFIPDSVKPSAVPITEKNLHSHDQEYVIPFVEAGDTELGSLLKASGENNNLKFKIWTGNGHAFLETDIENIWIVAARFGDYCRLEGDSNAIGSVTSYLPKEGGKLISSKNINNYIDTPDWNEVNSSAVSYIKNRTHYKGTVAIVDEDSITLELNGTTASAAVNNKMNDFVLNHPLNDYSEFTLVLTQNNAEERIAGTSFSSGSGGFDLSFGDYSLVYVSSGFEIRKQNADANILFDNIRIETSGTKRLSSEFIGTTKNLLEVEEINSDGSFGLNSDVFYDITGGVTVTIDFNVDKSGKPAIYKGRINNAVITLPNGTYVVNDNQYITYSGGVLTVSSSEYCEFEYNSYTKAMKLTTYLSL